MVVNGAEVRHRLMQLRVKGVAGNVDGATSVQERLIFSSIPFRAVIVAKNIVQLYAHLVCSILPALVGRIDDGREWTVAELTDHITDDRADEVLLKSRTALALDVLLFRDSLRASEGILYFHGVTPLIALVVVCASVRLLAKGIERIAALSGIGEDFHGFIRDCELVTSELNHSVHPGLRFGLLGP